jgi:hypothetical protein
MFRRILLASASVAALISGVLVASPANADPNSVILHDTAFDGDQQATDNPGQSRLQTNVAISANGERTVTVSSPLSAGTCASPRKIYLSAGTVTSSETSWAQPKQFYTTAERACIYTEDLSVQLSADGTSGIVSWIAAAPINPSDPAFTPELNFVTFSWPLFAISPTMGPVQSFSTGYAIQNARLALAKDGGRAVLTVATVTQTGGYLAGYVVIDMEHPEFARLMTVEGDSGFNIPRVQPVISEDSEVVGISVVRASGNQGVDPFRFVKVLTCQANCYPKRMKTFTANIPERQGATEIVTQMNAAGTRIVVAWSRDSSPIVGANVPARALRMIVLSPQTPGAAINVTTSVQYINSFDLARNTFALSADGTRFVAATDHAGTWLTGANGSVKVSSGTISPTGKAVITKTSSVTTHNGPLDSLSLSGSPERVVITQRGAGSATTFISDSIALKYWSVMYFASTTQTVNTVVSSAGARAIIGFDQDLGQNNTQVIPRVIVTNLKGILGMTASPKITGTLLVGKTVTATTGSWTARGDFTYDWLLDGRSILGQNGPTYDIEQADAGKQLSVLVAHTKSGFYDNAQYFSAGLISGGVITAPDLVITGVNSGINNRPLVRDAIRVDTSLWTPHDGTFTYVWKVGTKIVSSSATYEPVLADLGKRITVTITETRTGYTKLTKTSAPTEPVEAGR